MLNRNGRSRHPFLVPDLRGKDLCLSSLSMLLAMGCSYMAFVMLRWFSIPSLLIVFYHKRVLNFVKLFLHHLRLSCGFYLHSIHVVYYSDYFTFALLG